MNNSDEFEPSREPPDPPRPRFSWIMAGAAMIAAGVLLTMTVVMAAMGIIACIAGGILIVAAFFSDNSWDMRKRSNLGNDLASRAANAMIFADEESERKLARNFSKKPNEAYSPTSRELDADTRISEAIDESFPASDPPSWNAGVEKHHATVR